MRHADAVAIVGSPGFGLDRLEAIAALVCPLCEDGIPLIGPGVSLPGGHSVCHDPSQVLGSGVPWAECLAGRLFGFIAGSWPDLWLKYQARRGI